MKQFFSLLFAMAVLLPGFGQVNKEVIPSAVGSKTKGGVSINWTLGGIIIPTITTGTPSLIQGPQKQSIVAVVDEKLDFSVKPKIYPNPYIDYINIQFTESLTSQVNINVLDSHGRLVKSEMIESGLSEKVFMMQDLPAGIYYLRITNGKLENVYKVVKL